MIVVVCSHMEGKIRTLKTMDRIADLVNWKTIGNIIAESHYTMREPKNDTTVCVFSDCDNADIFVNKCEQAASTIIKQGFVTFKFVGRMAVQIFESKNLASCATEEEIKSIIENALKISKENFNQPRRAAYNQSMAFYFIMYSLRIKAELNSEQKIKEAYALLTALDSIKEVLDSFRKYDRDTEGLDTYLKTKTELQSVYEMNLESLDLLNTVQTKIDSTCGLSADTKENKDRRNERILFFMLVVAKFPKQIEEEQSKGAFEWMLNVVTQQEYNNSPVLRSCLEDDYNTHEKKINLRAGGEAVVTVVDVGCTIGYAIICTIELAYELGTVIVPHKLNRFIKSLIWRGRGWLDI